MKAPAVDNGWLRRKTEDTGPSTRIVEEKVPFYPPLWGEGRRKWGEVADPARAH